MFRTRQLTAEDYEVVKPWFEWFKFPLVPKESLPDNGTCGLMVSKNGVNICTGYLYLTNSNLCWIEFVISNPKYKEKDRKKAVNFLIDKLCDSARAFGCVFVFSSTINQNLINRYKECGFEIKDAKQCYRTL